jgi:hypothetical protein
MPAIFRRFLHYSMAIMPFRLRAARRDAARSACYLRYADYFFELPRHYCRHCYAIFAASPAFAMLMLRFSDADDYFFAACRFCYAECAIFARLAPFDCLYAFQLPPPPRCLSPLPFAA